MAGKKKPKKPTTGYFEKAEKEGKDLMKKHGVKTVAELEKVLTKTKK